MDCKELAVLLCIFNGKDSLEFSLEKEKKYIDLNSDDQTGLRDLFYNIVDILMTQKICFILTIEPSYLNPLFTDIAKEYVKKLNAELLSIYNNIPEELRIKLA